jgi:drug/metabolite transporter (DMT)-like permease
VLYTVWSTTYLAIALAVDPEGGFPPFQMSGWRILAAGAMVWLIARALGRQMRVSRRDLAIIVPAGLLLWIGGNGMVTWAEQYADSGYAALLVGALPIWTALLEAIIDRRLPSRALAGALTLGFSGVAVLTLPALRLAEGSDALAILALVLAPICWGGGTVMQARGQIQATPLVSAAYQQLAGGLGFLVLSQLVGEAWTLPLGLGEAGAAVSQTANWAWLYLVIVGGLAFISFVQAVKRLPTRVVMTYAYVNPVGAALLGWLFLQEDIDRWTLLGAALVIAGVAGVFRERYGRGSQGR